MVQYIDGIIAGANVFIAFFIAVYAYLFLMKTQHHRERRPWEFLFVASILYLFFELLALFIYFGIIQLVGVEVVTVSKLFEFLYSGFVLLAFISQHDLILRSHLILISKKDGSGETVVTLATQSDAEKPAPARPRPASRRQ